MTATGDERGLRALLLRIIHEPRTVHDIGRRAQERIRGYTWDRTARETIRFVEQLRESSK